MHTGRSASWKSMRSSRTRQAEKHFVARTAFERREEKLDKEEKKDERKEAVQRYAEDYEEAAMVR